ncbi:phenylalanyl-tRNA synthetase beta chain [Planctomycetaceae bacterium]|nr:phenylalanyl-tRNA synthetase beta chain [Planctomycetaceae bacterium]
MMKTTANWLADYVQTGLPAEKVAEILTLSGTEVEHQEPVGNDVCFTLEVTSNRTDCLSVLGLAREVAAVTAKPLKLPASNYPSAKEKASAVTSVVIEDSAKGACPYYTAQVIRGVKVGPSPKWLVQRLEGIGLKSINNVVDITNFVLFETGQPLHAFDLGKLAGRRIVVRLAKKDERFDPLIDKKRDKPEPERLFVKCDTQTLVIADAEKPQAIGGIMGGLNSGVTAATTEILLESACFEPRGIKATSRRHELTSDSSFRFERGVDPMGVVAASKRAAQLILECCGGEVLDGVIEAGAATRKGHEIALDHALISRVMGVDVSRDEVARILRTLGLSEQAGKWLAPSYRPDLTQPIDLVEEVGRVHGLDKVPESLRMTVAMARPSRRQVVRKLVRQTLMALGFSEALSDSFVNPRHSVANFSINGDSQTAIAARNPVNLELPALRRNLIGSMLLALQTNQRQFIAQPRLFEIANVFTPTPNGVASGEHEVIGLIGRDFADVRGSVDTLLNALGIVGVSYKADSGKLFAPGHAATISVGNALLGVIGEPAVGVMSEFKCEGACGVAELHFGPLMQLWNDTHKFVEPPKFPSAERDLAVVLDASRTWAEVEACARAACDATLRHVELFDEFKGKQVGAGKKSLAFRLTFRHDERTLRAEEVQAQVDAAVKALTSKLGGVLRA